MLLAPQSMDAPLGRAAQVGPPPVARSPNTCLPGTPSRNWCGDGRPATLAKLAGPMDVTAAPDGTLFIADTLNNVIRRIGPDGTIETVAGDGVADAPLDTEPAATASFGQPRGVAFAPDGSLYVADTGHDSIRRIAPDGTVTRVAGGRPALRARLRRPGDVVVVPGGDLIVADTGDNRVLRIPPAGRSRVLAGTGRAGFTGATRRATRSPLRGPAQIALLSHGDLLIADTGNRAVRWLRGRALRTIRRLPAARRPLGVAASGGRALMSYAAGVLDVTPGRATRAVAGTGTAGYNGDGRGLETQLDLPTQLFTAPDGTLLIAERGSDRIRRARLGELTTIAGTDKPVPAPPAAAIARAGRVAGARNCQHSTPRFRYFNFLPLVGGPLHGSKHAVKASISTSRIARVSFSLRDHGAPRATKTVDGVSNRHPRKVVIGARLKRHREYVLWATGTSTDDGLVRCDHRRVIVG
jgi:hypothetical protein